MYRKKYVPRSKGEMLYSTNFGVRDIWPKLWNLTIYLATYGLWLFLDSAYYNFGSKIITPLTGAMWIVGAVLAILLPSQRQDIIKHTKWFVLGYLAILFIYRYVIMIVSGVSAENLSASFGQAVASSSGTAILGWLQNLLWIIAITYPIAYFVFQGKKVPQFFGTLRCEVVELKVEKGYRIVKASFDKWLDNE